MSGRLFSLRPLTRKALAAALTAVFLAGWFLFGWYLYSNQILLVGIEGPIEDFQAITLALHQGKIDRNVKAVVLYLNTPGGLAYSCLEIGTYVKELAEAKPVIAVMGAECASGGYYIASFAAHIFTHENTVTGSIGVIAVWVDMSGYYEQQGINITVWTTGPEKDFGADWRPPTPEERERIQSVVDYIFLKLLSDIRDNRNLSDEIVEQIKTGAIFSGSDAVAIGLADEIGNLVDAGEEAVQRTGVWKYIIVTPYMDERQKFLKAFF